MPATTNREVMQRTNKQKLRQYLLWIVWILIIQIVLANISAAIYAYKFTHFYTNPPPYQPTKNILVKTWKLFVGPRIYKLPIDSTTPPGYEKIKLRTNNNLSIDGWYGSVDSAKGCVIFFHGISNNKALFLNEAREFRSWGYNVLLIDFRAHGKAKEKKAVLAIKKQTKRKRLFNLPKQKAIKILYYMEALWVR